MNRLNNQKTENVRAIALEVLVQMEKEKEYSHVLIHQVLEKYDYMDIKDKAFLKRLLYGTIERTIQLDYVINSFSKTPVKKMKPVIRCILRMSVYQLLCMDSVPDAAVCNEACKLAEKKGFHTLKGFVNGILRAIARGRESIVYPDKEKEPVRALSVEYSVAEWLVSMWIREYGEETTVAMLKGFLEERPVTVRWSERLSESEREAYLKQWTKAGVSFHKSELMANAVHITECSGVKDLAGFAEGAFYVQDISSMLAVRAADIRENDFVLDVCAAPGGKSIYAAELTGEDGTVVARDITEYKTAMIAENAERMRCDQVRVQCRDASVLDERMIERADVVLADLPCSGLGIIARKPDIKYNCSEESLKEVVCLQKKIIDTIWQYVKRGGTLLYSTCTLNREENVEMVQYILEHYPYELVEFQEDLRLPDSAVRELPGTCQLLPGLDETDGFFFARLKRKDA